MSSRMRIGQGIDVHRLVPDRPLILGGVQILHPLGLEGHSDADALIHSIIDALLGASGNGDIGSHFPDDDPAYRGADSTALLARVAKLVVDQGWELVNLDATVIAEKPRLGPYRQAMIETLATTMGIEQDRINLKAKTAEGLGALGQQEAIAAMAVVLLEAKASGTE